jgi:cyclin B
MLDWMIEVTSSYKFTAKTYFASVYLMDRYFLAEEARLPITRLHIIGVVSMLVATKMDEVFPLKVKTVYEKIVHKKIEKRELVEMEARMVDKLDFDLNVWSFHDLALLHLHDAAPANAPRNETALREIELLCEYIAKFVVFNYELFNHYDGVVLADALLRAAFRVFGVEKAKLLAGERVVERELSKDAMVCLELIFDTIRTFKATFKSISNIYKFTEPACVEQVEFFLRNH